MVVSLLLLKVIIMNLIWTGSLIVCLFALTQAMYFDLAEEQERCIIKEIPEDTFVTGYFLLEFKQINAPQLGIVVTVKDPNFEVLLMKRFGKYGKFTFTSHASGQHFLCVKSNSTRFLGRERVKVHLDLQIGQHARDPTAVKAEDTVKSLEIKMQHLIDQIQHISKQQDFQRDREETFRQMSEETNGNVLWWAIIQTFILLTVGLWQLKSLKHFFIKKKLV